MNSDDIWFWLLCTALRSVALFELPALIRTVWRTYLVVLKKVFKPSVILWFKFYFPGLRGFKFIVILNAFANIRCTEVCNIFGIKGPYSAPSLDNSESRLEIPGTF